MSAGILAADAPARDARSTLAADAALAGICALILVAPFEGREPLIRVPGQSLTTVEAALVAVLAAWAGSLAWRRTLPVWCSAVAWPFAAAIASFVVAAAASPVDRLNAAHMAGRLVLAASVCLLASNVSASDARLRRVYLSAAIAASAVSALVLFEYFEPAGAYPLLSPFRSGTAVVGGQVRAAGPFQYPTIASMFLEVVFALTVPLFAAAVGERRHRMSIALGLVLLLTAQALTLTFTRSGLITAAVSVFIIATVHYRADGLNRVTASLVLLAALVVLQFATSRSMDLLRLRLTSETTGAWYRAAFDAPRTLALPTGSRVAVPVEIRNRGRRAWRSDGAERFFVSYHWLLPNEDRVVSWEGLRTSFVDPVGPGETVTLRAYVEAPHQPGEYRLLWDIEQQHRLWFSTEPEAELAMSHATVTGAATRPPSDSPLMPLPRSTVRPGRLILWSAAMRMVGDHPVTGVGPDNFRLVYGQYAGLARSDPRIHSNNMYIEILAGGGLLSGAAFGWLFWRSAAVFRYLHARAVASPLDAGLVAAGVAIALHGLVDSFLSFTATYLVMAMVLGLAVARCERHRAHAHRI